MNYKLKQGDILVLENTFGGDETLLVTAVRHIISETSLGKVTKLYGMLYQANNIHDVLFKIENDNVYIRIPKIMSAFQANQMARIKNVILNYV